MRKIIFVVAILLSSLVLLAQDKSQPQKSDKDKGYTLSVETLEVQLPISVLDKEGRPVNGLTKDHFQIFEDKIQQTIKTFKHEDIPQLHFECFDAQCVALVLIGFLGL